MAVVYLPKDPRYPWTELADAYAQGMKERERGALQQLSIMMQLGGTIDENTAKDFASRLGIDPNAFKASLEKVPTTSVESTPIKPGLEGAYQPPTQAVEGPVKYKIPSAVERELTAARGKADISVETARKMIPVEAEKINILNPVQISAEAERISKLTPVQVEAENYKFENSTKAHQTWLMEQQKNQSYEIEKLKRKAATEIITPEEQAKIDALAAEGRYREAWVRYLDDNKNAVGLGRLKLETALKNRDMVYQHTWKMDKKTGKPTEPIYFDLTPKTDEKGKPLKDEFGNIMLKDKTAQGVVDAIREQGLDVTFMPGPGKVLDWSTWGANKGFILPKVSDSTWQGAGYEKSKPVAPATGPVKGKVNKPETMSVGIPTKNIPPEAKREGVDQFMEGRLPIIELPGIGKTDSYEVVIKDGVWYAKQNGKLYRLPPDYKERQKRGH